MYVYDDICSTPAKVVKSMRLALRKQWSRKCMELPLRGSVAEWLSQDANSKVITKLMSKIFRRKNASQNLC